MHLLLLPCKLLERQVQLAIELLLFSCLRKYELNKKSESKIGYSVPSCLQTSSQNDQLNCKLFNRWIITSYFSGLFLKHLSYDYFRSTNVCWQTLVVVSTGFNYSIRFSCVLRIKLHREHHKTFCYSTLVTFPKLIYRLTTGFQWWDELLLTEKVKPWVH